ncbi:MAG: ATP-binding protein [Clostridiales bacterium]|nr:ATP-binding protein [Clostridiales bacterium]
MRIIPKKTKVAMEFFKGVEIPDVVVGIIGIALVMTIIFSNLPFRLWIALVVAVLFGVSVVPVDGEKAYMMIYNGMKYLARYRLFRDPEGLEGTEQPAREASVTEEEADTGKTAKKRKTGKKKQATKSKRKGPTVREIVPFTGIDGNFIEYVKEYSGIAVNIPDVEFRFYSLSRQNQAIDQVFGSILRTISGTESAALIKVDRPVLYDSFLDTEQRKISELEEAFVNGLLNEEELTTRVGIIYDRMEQIRIINDKEKVYVPFYYMVFFHKDKDMLFNQAQNMVQTMASAELDCHILTEKELVVFLKYNYTQDFDEREVETLTKEQYLDWILPKEIRMTTRTILYDGLITHTLRVTDYPTTVGNAWGAHIFSMPGTRVMMKMRMVDHYKGIRQIDRAIDELREQAESTGKTSRLIELQNHVDTLTEVLATLQSDNETLLDVNLFVTAYDYEQTALLQRPEQERKKASTASVSLKRRLKRYLSEEGFRSSDNYMQQFEAYASTQVSGYDAWKRTSRGIHSSSVAAVFPFVNKMISDKNGVCIGTSRDKPVFIDFFVRDKDRVNSNMVVIGKSGSGKSYATKTILSNLAADNSKIFILDPENEYYGLAKNLNGKVIDVGSATQGRLNPFQIITSLSDEEEDEDEAVNTSFSTHLQFLEEFYRQILPGIEPDALEYLNNITMRMYEAKGIDSDTDLTQLTPEDYPIFDDLYEKILNDYQLATGEYSKENLRTLLNYVSKFATGGRNALLWNGPSSISTNENFIVFNFQSLLANKNGTIANAQMLLVLKWLDNEIIRNRDYNIRFGASRKIIVVIDEAHVFIDSKYPIALDFMYQLAKRIRKYNGMQIIITQNIADFVGTEELARKSTAIINACQYSFIFPLSPNDMHDLCRLYEKAGAINESEQEEIVNNGRGRAFVVTSPSSRTGINIVASKDMERLFTV